METNANYRRVGVSRGSSKKRKAQAEEVREELRDQTTNSRPSINTPVRAEILADHYSLIRSVASSSGLDVFFGKISPYSNINTLGVEPVDFIRSTAAAHTYRFYGEYAFQDITFVGAERALIRLHEKVDGYCAGLVGETTSS